MSIVSRDSRLYNSGIHKKARGFTIVELLIVIVIIAILATITMVSYNGVTARAKNTARLSMADNTMQLFEVYKAMYGDYPALAAGASYCVGTGYPNGKCRDYMSSGSNAYPETNTMLSGELKKVGSIPTGGYNELSGTVGPYVYTYSTGMGFDVVFVFDKSTMKNCPSIAPNLMWISDDDNRMLCVHSFDYGS